MGEERAPLGKGLEGQTLESLKKFSGKTENNINSYIPLEKVRLLL